MYQPATDDRSLAELARRPSLQTTELARHEVELAKAELRVKGKRAGIGAGMFGGAGALGVYALGALTAATIAGIAEALPVWAAALIVAALYGAIAGILALRGRRNVQQATPPCPRRPSRASRKTCATPSSAPRRPRDEHAVQPADRSRAAAPRDRADPPRAR